jgi:hypothetical protein
MEEIWKDIQGYEGLYQVSNYGNVKSLAREINRGNLPNRFQKEKLLKKCAGSNGYYVINLFKNKKSKTFTVHSLVALSFIGERTDIDINHIDGNKLNNTLSNLEYVSRRENTCHGKSRKYKIAGISFRKMNNKWRATPRLNGKLYELGQFDSIDEAEKMVLNFYNLHSITNKYNVTI